MVRHMKVNIELYDGRTLTNVTIDKFEGGYLRLDLRGMYNRSCGMVLHVDKVRKLTKIEEAK